MADLMSTYESIEACIPQQLSKYENFLKTLSIEQIKKWQMMLDEMGFLLCVQEGSLRYTSTFKPLNLRYDIVYVRHGKTQGNTEPRVFQGYVDEPKNQLNEVGKKQAEVAAIRMNEFMEKNNWKPDMIVCSPLKRAVDTCKAFHNSHLSIPLIIQDAFAEMKFGSWDNQVVQCLDPHHIGHLFYLKQNVLVKSEQPYKVPGQETSIMGENFIEMMLRIRKALLDLETHTLLPADRRGKVLFYGHSMAGAAVSILMGHGKVNEEHCIAFDGRYIMPNAQPTLLPPLNPASNQ